MFKLKLLSINSFVCTLGFVCLTYMANAQQKSSKKPTTKKSATKTQVKTVAMPQLPADSGINIGYWKQKKSTILGAIAVVPETKIRELVAVSIDALLQGQVAGMQVTNISGAPGSGALTTIRGASTINAGALPLYVVDGIPVKTYRFPNSLSKNADNNPLAGINPEDIAAITVLKDAQATALYGMRGANGVVVINTSGGTAGKTYLNFSAYTGIMNATNELPVLDANSYRSFMLEKERARGLTQQEIVNGVGRYLLVSTPSDQIERYNNNTNWQDVVSKQGYYNNYHLKLRGGDAVSKYSLNVGYLNQSGTVTNSSYERFTTRFNLDYKVSKKLTILNTISYSRTDKSMIDEGDAINTNPLYLATTKSPMLTVWRQDLKGTDLSKADSADFVGKNNPYAVVNKLKNINSTNRILGGITGQYVFSRYLTLNSSISADYIRLNETRFRPGEGFAPEGPIIRYAAENNSSEIMVMNENTLNFNKVYKNYSIHALVGNAFQSTEQRNEFAQAINSPSDEFTSISATDPQLLDSISSFEPSWKLMSFFASVNYTYKGKYMIGANLRADGSSRFAKGKQWGYFPSVAIAWDLKGESFLKKSKLLNEFKLRASYGATGNQEVGYYGSYNALVPAIYKNQPGVRLGMIGNLNFTWEKTNQFDAGIDLTFFKRLSLSADFYIKETRDLLNYIDLPGISGFTNYVVNDGSVRNTGVELSISAKVLKGKLSWQTGIVAAYNKNKILSQPQNQDPLFNFGSYQSSAARGSSIGSFYGYNAIGVYRTTAEVTLKNGADNNNPFRGGDIIFEDVDKNGIIDQADKKVIGNSNPKFFGGFSNLFSYKKFDLTVFMDFAVGGDVYNAQRASLEAMLNYDNQSTSINDRWRNEGDVTEMPRLLHGDAVGNTRFSSRWIEDGSYLRFKAITVGYNIPVRENRKVFKSARILFTAQNLYTFTKYKGYGPEVGSITNPIAYGADYGNTPQLKTFVLGLHLGL
jgi:TonB-linked SusC/RagA family outer membrane protein